MDKLTVFQKRLVNECLVKKKGCLSVPMGSGKTLISLALSSRIGAPEGRNATLVVVSKTLIESWKGEIDKFFGTDLDYEVYHSSAMSKSRMTDFQPACGLVITTADMLSKRYNQLGIQRVFQTQAQEDRGGMFPTLVNRYHVPKRPLLPASDRRVGSFLFSTEWKCILIDELQTYTTASSARCQAIASVFSRYRWALSGTPFNEPSAERVLGYHLIIGDATFPNCVPDAEAHLRQDFRGFNSTMVVRTIADVDFILPPCTEHIVEHDLSAEENAIYNSLRSIISEMRKELVRRKNAGDTAMARKFNAYLIGMITYTRQFLVCPLIPYATMAISMMNMTVQNEMIDAFKREMDKLDLDAWLSDPDACRSSRIKSVLRVAEEKANKKLIVFNCFRTNLNVLASYFPKDRPQFIVASEHSPTRRGEIMHQFERSANGVLFLTFELGAEGLNLQHSHVVLLVDVWWNCGKTQQAIARVLRRGQTEPVDIYFFTSGTGIEKGLFTKHTEKVKQLKELAVGPIKTKIHKLGIKEILTLIDTKDNTILLEQARREVRS